MPRDPQAPSNVLDYVQKRAELRSYIDGSCRDGAAGWTLVVADLMPYTSDARPPETRVIPPRYEDPGFDHQTARQAPIPRALAVVVAVYLGLPGPLSPKHDGGNQLDLPTHAFAKASEKLREAQEDPDADPWLLRQGVDLRRR